MRLDGQRGTYYTTPLHLQCCVVWTTDATLMMIFILRGKCDCYLHVFPFMIVSWCRQCLTYHEINFELNFTSLVCLAQQRRSANQHES